MNYRFPHVAWNLDCAKHLLSRTEFSADEKRVQALSQMSMEAAVESILTLAQTAPEPSPPSWVVAPWVNTERRFTDTTPDEFRKMHGSTNGRYARETADLRRWWLQEMVTTQTPLREMMTLFWHGHYASSIGKVLVSQAMFHQNEKHRQHGVGNFRTLLREMTRDPAMMIYLDLEDSDRTKPNENYARELYELFALGIGNYSQSDIMETAKALSGLVLDAPTGALKPARVTTPDTNRRFTRDGITTRLDPTLHDDGVKTVLGRKGNFGVDEIVDIAVEQKACGDFLSAKLIAYFGAVDKGNALRDRMSTEFRKSGYEIGAMLKVLFTSPEFYSEESRLCLIKSPIVMVVGSARQLSLELEPTPGLFRYLAALGQELFNPPNVKGWPGGESWIGAGTLALRYHFADIVLESKEPPGMDSMGRDRGRPVPLPKDPVERKAMLDRFSNSRGQGDSNMMEEESEGGSGRRGRGPSGPPFKVEFSPTRLFNGNLPESSKEIVDGVAARLLVSSPSGELRTAAVQAADRYAAPEEKVRAVVRLMLTSPEYQLC
jgi:uncharacterized protein (DUF1800 family)